MRKIALALVFFVGFNTILIPFAAAALVAPSKNLLITPITVNLATSSPNSNSDNVKVVTPPTHPSQSTGSLAAPAQNIKIQNQAGQTKQENASGAPGINTNPNVQAQTSLLGFPPALAKDIGAKLFVCDIGSYCSGDMGSLHWANEATINANDTKRGLNWYTENNQAKEGLLEISLTPFDGSWPSKAFYSQNISYGSSVFDFKTLIQPRSYSLPPVSTKAPDNKAVANHTPAIKNVTNFFFGVWNAVKNITKASVSLVLVPINYVSSLFSGAHHNMVNLDNAVLPTYYLRVVPLVNGQIAGAPSNQVKVSIVAPPAGFTLYSPPKIFSVKIKEFTPALAPDKGLCSHAMILDTDALMILPGGAGFVLKKAGDRICPQPFMGLGEESWYDQFWDALKSGLSWVSKAYDTLKSTVVDMVGSVACGGDSTCKMALSAGLDIGLTALGLPPSIPDFSQLSDQGLDYLAGEISSQVGCPDTVCLAAIKDKLKSAISQSSGIGSGCMDVSEAHNMGIEPVCLPDGAKAHWDPAASYRDSKIVLEVYRNFVDDPAADNATTTNYRIDLSDQAYNAGPVGGWITNIEPDNEKMQITKPLQAELFEYKSLPIPHMEKGQTMDIPINLVASDYWVPGHKELMHGWSTVIYHDGWPQYQYNDWWLLYYGANLSFSASINGCGYYGGDNNSCVISSDSYSATLPMGLYQ